MDTPTGLPLPYQPLPQIIFDDSYNAGDLWHFELFSDKYSDGSWTATIVFAAGTNTLSAPATLDGQIFTWNIPGTETITLPPQPYRILIAASNGTDVKTLQRSATIVTAATGSASWTDNATFLQQLLAEIEAKALKLARKEVTMVTFQGKQYHLEDEEKLWNLRNQIAARAADEWDLLRGNLRSHRIIPVFRNM